MKSDKEIWKESLDKEENVDLFKTEDGGEHSKPLPKKEIFASPKEKKLLERVKELEKQVEKLIKEIRNTNVNTTELKKQVKILRNKKTPQQKVEQKILPRI